MKSIGSFFNSNGSLRQKAINLFYLIFLILIFSFIPSDFVDSAHHSNTSLDLITQDINQLNKTSTDFFLQLLKDEPILYEQTHDKFQEIEAITRITTQFIDDLKIQLINVDKIDDNGFFKNGRSEYTSQELMIHENKGDTLFKVLRAFKNTMVEYLSSSDIDEFNAILPLPKYELTSDGNYIKANEFYFDRTPLNISILNLTHFKSRVERARVFTNQRLIKATIEENAAFLPSEFVNLYLENGAHATSSAPNFNTEPLLETEEVTQNETNAFYVELLSDTSVYLGHLIRYQIHISPLAQKPIQITVDGPQAREVFTMNTSGKFYFYPSKLGRYTINFIGEAKTSKREHSVIKNITQVQTGKLTPLYIGIDNPLDISTLDFDNPNIISAEITSGQVLKVDNKFVARVRQKGITTLKVFANMSYGKVKIAEQTFVVRELNNPIPLINGIKSGATVAYRKRTQLRKISLKTDEYMIKSGVNVMHFEFSRIHSNHSEITSPIDNNGATFNQSVLTEIRKAQSGDMLLFSNVTIKQENQAPVNIGSITIKVN